MRSEEKRSETVTKKELLKKAEILGIPAFKSWTNDKITYVIDVKKTKLLRKIALVLVHYSHWTAINSMIGLDIPDSRLSRQVEIGYGDAVYAYRAFSTATKVRKYFSGAFYKNNIPVTEGSWKDLRNMIETF